MLFVEGYGANSTPTSAFLVDAVLPDECIVSQCNLQLTVRQLDPDLTPIADDEFVNSPLVTYAVPYSFAAANANASLHMNLTIYRNTSDERDRLPPGYTYVGKWWDSTSQEWRSDVFLYNYYNRELDIVQTIAPLRLWILSYLAALKKFQLASRRATTSEVTQEKFVAFLVELPAEPNKEGLAPEIIAVIVGVVVVVVLCIGCWRCRVTTKDNGKHKFPSSQARVPQLFTGVRIVHPMHHPHEYA